MLIAVCFLWTLCWGASFHGTNHERSFECTSFWIVAFTSPSLNLSFSDNSPVILLNYFVVTLHIVGGHLLCFIIQVGVCLFLLISRISLSIQMFFCWQWSLSKWCLDVNIPLCFLLSHCELDRSVCDMHHRRTPFWKLITPLPLANIIKFYYPWQGSSKLLCSKFQLFPVTFWSRYDVWGKKFWVTYMCVPEVVFVIM